MGVAIGLLVLALGTGLAVATTGTWGSVPVAVVGWGVVFLGAVILLVSIIGVVAGAATRRRYRRATTRP